MKFNLSNLSHNEKLKLIGKLCDSVIEVTMSEEDIELLKKRVKDKYKVQDWETFKKSFNNIFN